jgi:hypothetical protein
MTRPTEALLPIPGLDTDLPQAVHHRYKRGGSFTLWKGTIHERPIVLLTCSSYRRPMQGLPTMSRHKGAAV